MTEVVFKRNPDSMTLHQLVKEFAEKLNLTPEQEFYVTARIKRLIHHEKWGVYARYAEYAKGVGKDAIANDPWLYTILLDGARNHEVWAGKSDEEIVTWDVGSHKFK